MFTANAEISIQGIGQKIYPKMLPELECHVAIIVPLKGLSTSMIFMSIIYLVTTPTKVGTDTIGRGSLISLYLA